MKTIIIDFILPVVLVLVMTIIYYNRGHEDGIQLCIDTIEKYQKENK